MDNKIEFVKSEFATKEVALYSINQNCFHIEPLYKYLESNIKNAICQDESEDYMVIGVFDTGIEAHEFIEAFRKYLNNDAVFQAKQIIKNK